MRSASSTELDRRLHVLNKNRLCVDSKWFQAVRTMVRMICDPSKSEVLRTRVSEASIPRGWFGAGPILRVPAGFGDSTHR